MKYKFNINSSIPPPEQIERHKDFKKLRANYDEAVKPLYKKRLYRDMRAFIVVLIILLLTYLLVEVYEQRGKDKHSNPPQQEKK